MRRLPVGTVCSHVSIRSRFTPSRLPRPRWGGGGFTLIEVLVALVILSVGLLALESLGIVSARSISRAERQSRQTLLAIRTLEQSVDEVRRGSLAESDARVDGLSGDSVRREVRTDPPRRVRVVVIPNPEGGSSLLRGDSVSLTFYP